MKTDLTIGIAIMMGISRSLFVAMALLSRKWSRTWAVVGMVAAAAFLVAHAVYFLDRIELASFLPFSNLIVVGNYSPVAAGILAGLAWNRLPGSAWRRSVLLAMLFGICLWKAYGPLFVKPPEGLVNNWKFGVCEQSSESSCSAAAAATALKRCGIEATENEMAELCLTSVKGTSMHGLYRGLKIKTQGTDWELQPITGSYAELLKMTGPLLITVGIPISGASDIRYSNDWGWKPGVRHTVVVFGPVGREKVDVGDPSVGREYWDSAALQTLWRGQGIRLIQKPSKSP